MVLDQPKILTNSFIFILQLFLEIDDQTPDIKKFECSICGKHVRHQKTLIYHIRRVHKDLNKHVHDSDAKSNDDRHEIAEKNIEKILPNLEMNEIQMEEPDSDLNKHIQAVHDSDVKSDDDKDEVADETIEMNEIQLQEPDSNLNTHIQAVHDSDVKSDDDETMIFDENKIRVRVKHALTRPRTPSHALTRPQPS